MLTSAASGSFLRGRLALTALSAYFCSRVSSVVSHDESALEHNRTTELGLKLLLHMGDEVGSRVDPVAGRLGSLELDLLGHGLVVLSPGDVAVALHVEQDFVPTLDRAVQVVVGVEPAGLLR